MASSRRYFIKSAGLSLFGIGFVPSFLRRTAFALEQPTLSAQKKILVAIFQRGAADGLNIVVPYGEPDYYSLRPTIAIPRPSATGPETGPGAGTAIDLDGFFGLHPSLAALKPLYDAKSLAIVEAAGSPDNSRSHFDAQDYMESATPGLKSTQDGWLNRYLQADPEADATPFRAVAFGPRMPRTLQGAAPALALDDLRSFHLPGGSGSYAERLGGTVQAMYASASDPMLSSAANEMFGAVSTLQKIGVENYAPANGAQYPRGPLGRNLQQIAQLIKSGVGLEVAFAEVGGWDYHVNEGGVEGQLAARLKEFGDALAAFHLDLGDRMADVCVLTMTEFGRTARENGNRGTDHGHANVMFVLGGDVRGGKVYGKWPGLKPHQLNEGRDLALTTDFRDVFAEVLVRHLGAQTTSPIFPGFTVSPSRFRGFLR
ncbi:MAG: hypothetical protein DMG21_02265 [Acidobacteria bacterium]|nr:MAG: hypothetical protein DMG21_02265 [Acidobacteriota bacterium]